MLIQGPLRGVSREALVCRQTPDHDAAIRDVTAAAFADPDRPHEAPAEAGLVDELRGGDAWIERLSLVAAENSAAEDGGLASVVGDVATVVGHVLCTRAWLDRAPVLALGPLSVHPNHQRRGVGHALMHAVLGAADALDEPLVVVLGDLGYYGRFGFRPADEFGIVPPVPEWLQHFGVRPLSNYTVSLRGTIAYAEPFMRL